MMLSRMTWGLPLALLAGCSTQEAPPPASPYAGEQIRTVKALSPDEIEGLRTGQGLGFAKAAELNHYPGPRHVLDLAADLALTDEQHARTRAIFEQMRADAIPLGEQIVAQEGALDSLFANRHATPGEVQDRLREIGALRADLRFIHLNAHLALHDVLTPEQIQQYDILRGYDEPGGHTGHEAHTRH